MNIHFHRLSAIMFSDIVGYTALMGKDETKGMELLQQNREIQKPLIEKYQGSWIKEMGDGMMARFDSAYNATKCAIEIQIEAKKELNAELRIGLHLGEIVIENEDIFGDGVNIASRIESLADPGAIYISEPIHKALQNHAEIQTEYLGRVNLKNVEDQVKIYYITNNDITIPSRQKVKKIKSEHSQKAAHNRPALYMALSVVLVFILSFFYWFNKRSTRQINSLAVLPFANFTGSEEEQYFVDMMHDAVIGEISKIGKITVKSRTSTLRFRETNLSIQEIAKILDVDALIESSVYKTGDSVLLHVQLIHSRPVEDHVWSQEFEQDTRHILSLYGELARAIAREIEIQLTPQEVQKLTHNEEVDPLVYKTYLNGQYNWLTLSKEGIENSKKYFDRVIEMDPEHALAHAGLAIYYVAYAQQGHVSFYEAGPIAEFHAKKALETNNMLPEVYLAAAFNAWMQWELNQYLHYFKKALELNPNYAEVRAYMGQALVFDDQPDEAIKNVQIAIELDPLNSTYKALYGMCYFFQRRYDESLAVLLDAYKDDQDHAFLNSALRSVYHQMGRFEEAFEIWEKSYTIKNDAVAVVELKNGYQSGGYEMALQKLAEHLIRKFNNSPEFIPAWNIATIYTRAGKKEEAIIWLEKAYESHSISMPFIQVDPIFDYMRDDPRFQDMVEKMNSIG